MQGERSLHHTNCDTHLILGETYGNRNANRTGLAVGSSFRASKGSRVSLWAGLASYPSRLWSGTGAFSRLLRNVASRLESNSGSAGCFAEKRPVNLTWKWLEDLTLKRPVGVALTPAEEMFDPVPSFSGQWPGALSITLLPLRTFSTSVWMTLYFSGSCGNAEEFAFLRRLQIPAILQKEEANNITRICLQGLSHRPSLVKSSSACSKYMGANLVSQFVSSEPVPATEAHPEHPKSPTMAMEATSEQLTSHVLPTEVDPVNHIMLSKSAHVVSHVVSSETSPDLATEAFPECSVLPIEATEATSESFKSHVMLKHSYI
ncbi:hypothetical protein M9458_054121 [Cirrhinus mrigala]|uniref:Uncharacterized protein n=1 Tax=Cirrhinus mrigala TaxID=683832 RepID=A0ABD0MQW3_CIRMR